MESETVVISEVKNDEDLKRANGSVEQIYLKTGSVEDSVKLDEAASVEQHTDLNGKPHEEAPNSEQSEQLTEEGEEKVESELVSSMPQKQVEQTEVEDVETISQVAEESTNQEHATPKVLDGEQQNQEEIEEITPDLGPPRILQQVERPEVDEASAEDPDKSDAPIVPNTEATQEQSPKTNEPSTDVPKLEPDETMTETDEVVEREDKSVQETKPHIIEKRQTDSEVQQQQVQPAEAGPSTVEVTTASDPTAPAEVQGTRKSRFKLKISKFIQKKNKEKNERKTKTKSLERRVGSASIGTNIKSAFGTLKRGLSQRRDKPEPLSSSRPSRPSQPPPRLPVDETGIMPIRASSKELEQRSLSSMSGPSLSNTPEVSRRNLIEQELNNLMDAASVGGEGDTTMVANGTHQAEVDEQNSTLLRIATSISKPSTVDDTNLVVEDEIKPVHAALPPISNKNDISSSIAGSPSKPKPARPISRPALSPIDYQHHQEIEEDGSELVQKRMGLLQSMSPPPPAATASNRSDISLRNSPTAPRRTQVYSPHQRNYTNSLQRDEYGPSSSPNMRRAHTMRHMDYASRIQDRVKSIRREPSDMNEAGYNSSIRPYKPMDKRETYVCSDSFKIPKISFPFKRGRKADKNLSQGKASSEVVIPRPNFPVASPPPARYPRPVRPTSSMDEIVPAGTTVQMAAPAPRRSPSRQLTSLKMTPPAKEPVELPYISEELWSKENLTDETQKQDEKALTKTHEFLDIWSLIEPKLEDETATEDVNEKPLKDSLTTLRLQDFLNACTRLHSVDLEGQFAAFHYPLLSFDRRLWKQCAYLANWTNLSIVRGPVWKTEYLELPTNTKSGKFFYTEKSIDCLMASWLKTHSVEPEQQQQQLPIRLENPDRLNPVFHPVLFVTSLEQLLNCNPYTEVVKNNIIHDCLRLAVLLSYASLTVTSPEEQPIQLCEDSKEILVALSTSNCLVIFRPKPEQQTKKMEDVPEPGPDVEMTTEQNGLETKVTLLSNIIGPDTDNLSQSIDKLIERISHMANYESNAQCILPTLLKAIAPPDWMAIMIAAIIIKKSE